VFVVVDHHPPSPKRLRASTSPRPTASTSGERRVYHKCRNCRVTSTTLLCYLCRKKRQCRRCHRHLDDHKFETPHDIACIACTKRRNNQTRSALYDTITSTTLEGDNDYTPQSFLQRNEYEIVQLLLEAMQRHW